MGKKSALKRELEEKERLIERMRELLMWQEESHRRALSVLEGEVKLLKEAFVEMKGLYERHLALPHETSQQRDEGLDPRAFFALMAARGKTTTEIKKIVVERLIEGDRRFIFDGHRLWIANDTFEDLE
ncbi:MAG: hypothetical protein K6347_06190 [Campylobacterales bacterium]